jgi:hypothetical protein
MKTIVLYVFQLRKKAADKQGIIEKNGLFGKKSGVAVEKSAEKC